jgi:hypothetical protein
MGRRIFEAVAGIVLLVVAFVAAYLFQQAYQSGVEYRGFPVPLKDIPPYTVLTEDMFELKDFPSALTGGYADTLSQLTGRMSNSRIPAGLPVPLALISAPEDYRLADPSPPSAIGGQIKAGDKVNFYRLIPPGSVFIPLGKKDPILDPVALIAENIPVVMVLGSTARTSDTSEGGRVVSASTLIVAVNDEQREALLMLMGDISSGAIMWVTLAPVQE